MGFRFRKRVRLFKGPALSGIGHLSLLILEFVEGWCLAQPNFFCPISDRNAVTLWLGLMAKKK